MKVKLQEEKYDTLLLPIEWRYSAAALGLKRFFDYVRKTEGKSLYEITSIETSNKYPVYDEIGGFTEGMLYCQKDITEQRYLGFCEEYFADDMPHVKIQKILQTKYKEYNDEEKAYVNDLLKANTIMKKVFGKLKFDGSNKDNILKLIELNKADIIRETFRYKTNLYRNFANVNKLFSEDNPHCRLLGYDLDENRKSKSTAYKFDTETFVSSDVIEFDFIPFAFTNSFESFFINNNCTIDDLEKCNDIVKAVMESKNEIKDNKEVRDGSKTKFIKGIIKSGEFQKLDAEVIIKSRDKEIFESFIIRNKVLEALKEVYSNFKLKYIYKYNFNYYLDVEEELINCCINNLFLDGLIERLLVISKDENQVYVPIVIDNLITINTKWKEDSNMTEAAERAGKAGKSIAFSLKAKGNENKVKTYKNKLVNAIVSHDKDRVLEIMLQLSAYIGSEIRTIYDIIDNESDWFDIATAFANALVVYDAKNN